jgi:hypothetical protein
MTIFEYFKEPHPWFDTTNYTLTMVIIFFCSAMLWVWAYIDTIKNIIKKKTLNIPVIPICLNFGYEVTTSFFFLPNMGKAVVFGYWAWMLLDLFIITHAFMYGDKQIRNPYIQKNFKLLFVLGAAIAFTVEYFFITNYDIPMAPFDAYIINFIMSVSFIYLVFIPNYEGNSMVTAWTKFLGTGWTSVMFQMKYPDNHFLTTLYIATAIFDIFYIYLLYKKNKKELDYAIR